MGEVPLYNEEDDKHAPVRHAVDRLGEIAFRDRRK